MSEAIKNTAYESILVVSCKLSEEERVAVIDKFKTLIEANGTLESVDEWGTRKLAYPIQKQGEGYYVLFYFSAPVEFPAELERIYNITEGVLRSIVVKRVGTEKFDAHAEKLEKPIKVAQAETAVEAVEAEVVSE